VENGKDETKRMGVDLYFFAPWVSLGWDGEICPPLPAPTAAPAQINEACLRGPIANRYRPQLPPSAHGEIAVGTLVRKNLPVILKTLTPSYASMHKLLPSDWPKLPNPIPPKSRHYETRALSNGRQADATLKS
jgi:hypothetical protein